MITSPKAYPFIVERRVLCLLTMSMLVGLGLAGTASADVVILENGDRITGEVIKKEKQTLKLKTAYAGEIEIKWSQVSRLEMDEAAEVVLKDQSVVKAIAIARDDEEGLKQAGKEAAVTLETNQVDRIHPEPSHVGKAGKFSGRLNFSMQLESLPERTDEINADFMINYRRGKNRFGMKGQLDYDQNLDETTTKDWVILPKYDRFFNEKLYGSLWYAANQQKFKGVELRQMAGPSVGYQFSEGKPTELMGEIGVVFVDENYTDAEDNQFIGPAWRLEFQQDLFKGRLQFYHNNYFILSAEDTSKILWRSWTGFRFPISHGLVGSLEYEMDYDSEPVLREESSDNTLRMKIGYQW